MMNKCVWDQITPLGSIDISSHEEISVLFAAWLNPLCQLTTYQQEQAKLLHHLVVSKEDYLANMPFVPDLCLSIRRCL